MTYRFSCPGCGYSAEVSGGRDGGMLYGVETSICGRCRELIDVITVIGDRENKSLNEKTGKCPKCESEKYTAPWDRGEMPCPKCGGKMEKDKHYYVPWD